MRKALFLILVLFLACSSYQKLDQELTTGRILWDTPLPLRDGSFWLSSETQRRLDVPSRRLKENTVSFYGLEPGWYKVNYQEQTSSTKSSGWIPVYAGWEAGMVWDYSQNIHQDLAACRSSLYSQDPNLLLQIPLPVNPETKVEAEVLKEHFPWAQDSKTLVLTHNHPGALMGKGGLSSNWFRGSAYHRRSSESPWFFIAQGEPEGFLEYLLITQKSTDMRDDFNPQRKTIQDMGSGNGYLTWPQSQALTQLEPLDDPALQGSLESFVLPGVQEGYQKKITVYTPSGYSGSAEPYKTLYFHDAQMHLQYGITNAFDRWFASGETPPFVAVFVDNDRQYRSHEFLPDGQTPKGWGQDRLVETRIASGDLPDWFRNASDYYQRLWGEQLIPAVESRYNLSSDPADRAIHGASNGSVISFIILNRYPGLFGNAACVSGFSGETDFSQMGQSPLRLFFGYGRYEMPMNEIGFSETQVKYKLENQPLVTLQTYAYPGGHDPVSWANDLPRIMEFWWGK